MSDAQEGITEKIYVGAHCYWFEPPAILHVRLEGDIELPFAIAIGEAVDRFAPKHSVYLLRDARKSGVITRDAREYLLRHLRSGSIIAAVTYGASFHTRVIVTMLTRAMRTFHRAAPEAIFVADEAAARAWIANHQAARVSTKTP